jgi:hypothetical protein
MIMDSFEQSLCEIYKSWTSDAGMPTHGLMIVKNPGKSKEPSQKQV